MNPRTILLIAVFHFIIALAISLYTFSAEMVRFDTGENATALEIFARAISAVLLCPAFLPMAKFMGKTGATLFSGMLGYIPLFLNSMIWGVSVSYLVGVMRKIKRQPDQAL